MTGINTDSNSAEPSDELSADERAAIFAAANAPVDRIAAFRAGRVPIPPKALAWTVAAILFLGVGGIVTDHYFPNFSNATTPTSIVKSSFTTTTTTNPASANTINSLQAFMGLKFINTANATDIALTTQSGNAWDLASQKGKVVVLTFYDSTCDDICPVVGAEIKQASQQLGQYSSRVEFVVVNTDPRQTSVSNNSAALQIPGLANSKSVTLLSGTVNQLNKVWTSYGILIKIGTQANQISHNNALYFIGPQGKLAAFSKPFAQEDSSGKYSLDAATIHRYGEGIAVTADSLFQ
ncbi:MAG TPA: SCO family protein [Acidimicrobiales bacterium]